MAIFTLKNIKSSDGPFKTRYFNELQVNGEDITDNDDFTMDDEESADTGSDTAETGENAPEEAAQDAAENPEEQDINAAEDLGADSSTDDEDNFTLDDEDDSFTTDDNENTSIEDSDDFTMDDEESTDTGSDTADTGENTPEEATQDVAENPEEEGDNPDTDQGSDDDSRADNFTMDDRDAGSGEAGADEEGGTSETGEEGDQGSNNAAPSLPADPTDNISDEDIKASEEQIYDSLTDDQKRIRVLQLKIDYKDLYETIITTKEGINSIPKTIDNLNTIKRLTLFTEKTKSILIDYIQNNFDKNPYLENYAMYIKFMAVFRTISKVIEELNDSRK